MDSESTAQIKQSTQPLFPQFSNELIKILRHFDVPKLAQLMKLSDKLAALNVARNLQWEPIFNIENAKQAIFVFTGDVYEGFDAKSLTELQLISAQHTVRSLSGLYGILRPLDLMHPYRLEMGTRLPNKKGKDLYAFWGDHLVDHLNKELASHQDQYLINLASDEYFKAIPFEKLKYPLIQPIFQDGQDGIYKIISFYAKRARGLMARFIVQNQIKQPKQLKDFSSEGYRFLKEETTKNGSLKMIFIRDNKR